MAVPRPRNCGRCRWWCRRQRVRWFDEWRERRAIRSYLRHLPRLLQSDYGFSRTYTAAQVYRTIERSALPRRYAPYAAVLFANRESVEATSPNNFSGGEFDLIRVELLNKRFGHTSHPAGDAWSETAGITAPDATGHGPGGMDGLSSQ